MTTLKSKIRDIKHGTNFKVVEPVNLYECVFGNDVFVGPFVEITKGVEVGDKTRISSHSFICELVSIGNNCFVGHGVMFTNDLFKTGKLGGGVKNWKKTKIGNKNILRPLLYSTKEDLLFVSKLVFNFYVVDPTNFDEKFQRIRIRKMIKFLENNGLDMKKFLKTIGNLKTSNSIVDFYVTRNLKVNSYFNFKKDKIILSSEFFLNPSEVVFRSLSDIIKIVGKKHYSVRGRKLDYLIKKVQKSSNLKVTLGGCIIEKVNQTVIISKEH